MGAIRYNSSVPTIDAAVVTPGGASILLGSLIAVNPGATDRAITVNVHRLNGGIEPTVTGLNIAAGTAQELVFDLWTALSGLLICPGESLHASASGTGRTLLAFD